MNESLTTQIEKNGFAVLPQVFTDPEVKSIRDDLARAFLPSADVDPTIRRRNGVVYAARNVLSLFPATAGLWRKPEILALLRDVLGADFGLVRVLFFDKPPERTWTLPWHKDVTIAIAEPEPNSGFEREVLRKVGIPHIEAPRSVLDGMLTIRLHLDDVTEENGPLKVITGSHRTGKQLTLDDGPRVSILVERGDVLAIRPLVSHCSGRSADGSQRHRRILHFEFSGERSLPNSFQWRDYISA
jgi:ectoine hydroxylase-related dioxygenase (phytanoyl-CoA dioxygenase family)